MCVNILYVGKMGQTVNKNFTKTYARWGNRTFINIKYRQKPLQISPLPLPPPPRLIQSWYLGSRGLTERDFDPAGQEIGRGGSQQIRARSSQSEDVPTNQNMFQPIRSHALQPIGVRSHQSEHVPANQSTLQPIGVRSHQSEHVPANQNTFSPIRTRSSQSEHAQAG